MEIKFYRLKFSIKKKDKRKVNNNKTIKDQSWCKNHIVRDEIKTIQNKICNN
jgi:hypothetical protein